MPLITPKRIQYLGVDPGVSGGIAVLWDGGCTLSKMPETDSKIWWTIRELVIGGTTYAALEKVGGWMGGNRDKQGNPFKHDGQTGSAMFKFGMSAGKLKMALIAVGLIEEETLFEPVPISWQTLIGAPRGSKGRRAEHKRELKDFAQQLFDQGIGICYSGKITLATCDAFLLAHYAKMRHEAVKNQKPALFS